MSDGDPAGRALAVQIMGVLLIFTLLVAPLHHKRDAPYVLHLCDPRATRAIASNMLDFCRTPDTRTGSVPAGYGTSSIKSRSGSAARPREPSQRAAPA
jgi:hypothetical protein